MEFNNNVLDGTLASCASSPFSPILGPFVGRSVGGTIMGLYGAATSKSARPGRLNAAFVRAVNRPGVYGDQHGLRLRAYKSRKRESISKQWIWRGTVNGTRRDIGLGGFPYVTLAEARQTAFEYRKKSKAGCDPKTLRRRPRYPSSRRQPRP